MSHWKTPRACGHGTGGVSVSSPATAVPGRCQDAWFLDSKGHGAIASLPFSAAERKIETVAGTYHVPATDGCEPAEGQLC